MADHNPNDYNGGAMISTVACLQTLTWLSVGLRTYSRACLTKSFQVDDWCMLISQIIFTLSCVFVVEGVSKGMGRHNDAITDENARTAALMYQALAAAAYVLDMMFIKLSIGLFLTRFSVERMYTLIIWTSLVIISIWSTVTFFWDLFQCTPIQRQWDFRIKDGHCSQPGALLAMAYSFSVMTIVSDWLYALLPIAMLWNVKMTKQAKMTVILILGLGVFASIATLIRLNFISAIEDDDDLLFSSTETMVWTLVEPGVAIVAASLATIRPLLRKMKISGFESSNNNTGTSRSAPTREGHRSRSAMGPAYPLDDVSPDAIGPEPKVKPQFSSASLGVTPRDQDLSQQGITRTSGRNSPDRSEIYVIQNHQPTSNTNAWHSRTYSSPSRSFEDIHDLEAQSQESARFGLNSERR